MKLIGIDLDGTLLNSNQEISNRNKETLIEISKSSLPFICTGRDIDDVSNILKNADLSIVTIGSNGAVGYHGSKKLFEFSFSKQSIREVASTVLKYPTKIYSNIGSYESFNYNQSLINIFNEIGAEFSNAELEYELEYEKSIVSTSFDSIEEILKIEGLKIYKFFIFIPNTFHKQKLLTKLQLISNINVTESSSVNIEIIPDNVSKGRTFELLEEIFELKDTTRYAIGDSLNDLSLFEESDVSFAMENGHRKIKEIASYITVSNDDDGVTEALNIIASSI